jgi:hypothetical protein
MVWKLYLLSGKRGKSEVAHRGGRGVTADRKSKIGVGL